MSKKHYTQADWDAAEVWWEIDYGGQIKPVRVVKETEKTVTVLKLWASRIQARRRSKDSGSFRSALYRTWEQARHVRRNAVRKALREAEEAIPQLKARLASIEALTEPKEPTP